MLSPRAHLTRFHDIFAPDSKHRSRIIPKPCPAAAAAPEPPIVTPDLPLARQQQAPSAASATAGPDPLPPPSQGPYRLPWATLLRRVFAIEVLTCDRCGGKRRLVALIDKDAAIKKILTHLGLPTQSPVAWPARAPPRATEGGGDWWPQDGIDPIVSFPDDERSVVAPYGGQWGTSPEMFPLAARVTELSGNRWNCSGPLTFSGAIP